MKYKVIVNPIAGRGFGERSTPTIRRLLSEHGLDFDLSSTTYPGEAVDLARQAILDGYDVVVAAGGDGTYHEAINGMIAAHEGDPPDDGVIGTIGVLPVGSGCEKVGFRRADMCRHSLLTSRPYTVVYRDNAE